MMQDKRFRIAVGMMLSVLSLLGGVRVVAASVVDIRYVCEGNQTLSVRQSRDQAGVRFNERTYMLDRKVSSFGERFSSIDASLAVDGDFAVFVAGERLQLRKCVEAGRTGRAD